MTDHTWAQVARDSREALANLGRPVAPKCLPDEPEACGASFELHALAHFATIKAICDHQLTHLRADADTVAEIYLHTLTELTDGPCGLDGGTDPRLCGGTDPRL